VNKKLIKQVAKVIGKKLAVHELSIVDAAGLVFTHADTVHLAFLWAETPQGESFWCDINLGKWPYNYKRGKSNE
jgi:hypothetical protein